MLVYNQDRSIQYEAEVTKDVIKLMAGGNKRYFEAVLDGNNKVNLGKHIKEQYW